MNPRRDPAAYFFYHDGPHARLGREAPDAALAELFRAVFRRRNLRRVPGPQGGLKRVRRPGGFSEYLSEDWGTFTPFPVSMKVMWDD